MKRLKTFIISLVILCVLLVLGYGYYRYTNYYYGQQFYKECLISSKSDSYVFSDGEKLEIPVFVDNNSRNTLKSSNNYYLSYHLLDESGKELDHDGLRTPLGAGAFSSQEVAMGFEIPKPGAYQLEVDIIREGYYWHGDLGGKTLKLNIMVE